ncbi:MAG: NADPH:quinone reductase [Oculatellaceae cyanobacterium bins.114]|nr:NADPH:quinone reductase [Oculatellaceae cyanobacterium bins.114]
MKAIRVHQFGTPEVLQIEEVPDFQPAPGQVVMQVKAIGVNPLHRLICAGLVARPPLPFTPGDDAAGVVAAVGEGVTTVNVGDRVYGGRSLTGTYAEQVLYDAAEVYPLPDNTSFAQGASLRGPYYTAHYVLYGKGRGTPGETVLVHGASGGVGIAAVQMARAAGFYVIGTASSEKGRELVKQEGAHHVFDHSAPGYIQEILDLTQGRGVDLILDMKADVNLPKSTQMIAFNGRIVMIGGKDVGEGAAGRTEFNPFATLFKNADILGLFINAASPIEILAMKAAIFAGLENGTLRPIIGQEMPLSDAPKALELIGQSGAFGKIILIP